MSDELTPLGVLARKLRSFRPPSLSTLLAKLADSESYAEFVKLVKEFLPEREKEILKELGIDKQVASFASYFEDRYFPLAWHLKEGEVEEYSDLVEYLPLIPLGFGYQDYDELVQDGNPPFALMTYFFQQPYGDEGARVALGESCQEIVPVELLKALPEKGFTREEMHRLLDGTSYQPLALWGDAINLSTGNDFLDTDEEMMSNSVMPEWSRANVEYFTRQWKEAEKQQHIVNEFAEKFEKEPAAFFREILDFIDKQKERKDGNNLKQRDEILPVGPSGGS